MTAAELQFRYHNRAIKEVLMGNNYLDDAEKNLDEQVEKYKSKQEEGEDDSSE